MWKLADKTINATQAARRYVADTFDGRELNVKTLAGGWTGKRGLWTFKIVGGSQPYELTCDENGVWSVLATILR